MHDSLSFDITIVLSKSSAVDFWIYSVEEVAPNDIADVYFYFLGRECDRWTGTVVEVIKLTVHGRQFWLAKLNVAHVPPSTVTPMPTSSDDLINVSVTISASNGSYKHVREYLPAIVKH